MHVLFDLAEDTQSITCAMHILFDHTDEQREATDVMIHLQSTSKCIMKSYEDAGFHGSDKDMNGADIHHPFKKPKNKELISEEKAYNCELSKKRIISENAIGAAK